MGTKIRPEVSEKNLYWISKHRYYELKHFCMQYPEWEKAYHSLDGYPKKSAAIIANRSGEHTTDPTAMYAEARAHFQWRMGMVDNAARMAAGDYWVLLKMAVILEISYEKMEAQNGGMPISKDMWYVMYRKFFWLLDKVRT